MPEHEHQEEFSFKKLFIPLTTLKAVHWIIIIGFVVYINIFFNGFAWEDNSLIINNINGHSLNIFSVNNTFNSGYQFRPISALYSAILYSVFSNASFFWHFPQLSLHIINTVLVFLIFKYFFKRSVSFFLALLFLVHPINVESVTYIGSLDNPLFFFFGTLALLLSFKKEINRKRFFAIGVLLLLSSFSRETGVIFLFLIVCYQFLNKRKNAIYFYRLCALEVIIYFLIRYLTGNGHIQIQEVIPIDSLHLAARLINIPAILLFYIQTFSFPLHLSAYQVWIIKSVNFPQFYLPLLLDLVFMGLIILFGIYLFKNQLKLLSPFIFFFCWFFLGLIGYLQIFPLNLTVADHWFYFPFVGLIGMLGTLITIVPIKKERLKLVTYILCISILVILSVRTIIRNSDWNNTITLFVHDSSVSDNFMIENTLGEAYGLQGQYDEALVHFKKSASMSPNESNLYNIAQIYGADKDGKDAEKYYLLSINSSGPLHENSMLTSFQQLENISILYDTPQNARKISLLALRAFPKNGGFWTEFAYNDYKLHKYQDALIAIKNANYFSPNNPTTQALYTKITLASSSATKRNYYH